MRVTLDKTPPELAADILEQGIVLTGGGTLLNGLDARLSAETGMPIVVAANPLLSGGRQSVPRGGGDLAHLAGRPGQGPVRDADARRSWACSPSRSSRNVGMTMGIMPITGIPLPFVSHGGSSTVASFAGVGLALNVHMRRFT